MQYRYLKEVKTIEELRRQYKQLAFKYHPDREGGSVQAMQSVNAEYDELYKVVKNVHQTADGKTYAKKEEHPDIPDNFREIIDAIINFNVDIEICGSWIWVFKAYNYKEQLKALGFFYCSGKKAWAWTNSPTNNKHRLTLDEIRRLHGSGKIREQEDETKEITGAA